jgi:hypothetical protein
LLSNLMTPGVPISLTRSGGAVEPSMQLVSPRSQIEGVSRRF